MSNPNMEGAREMTGFKNLKQAVTWAESNTPSPRWLDVVVKVGPDYFRLQTTHIASSDRVVTRAYQVYGKEQGR
jgi:dihydroorotate dehydrogenase